MAIQSIYQAAPARPGTFPLGNLKEFRKEGLGLFIKTAREQGDVARVRANASAMFSP